jgi:Ca2+-binding EF-hand superfamily protein
MAEFFSFSNNYQINYCKLLPPYLNFSLNSLPYFNFINNTKTSMSKQNQKSSGFDATKFVKDGVPLEVVQEIKAAFDLFDSDQGGSVDTKELKAAMTSLGFESKNGSIFQMIADLDSDGNGNIDFPEWLALMTTKVGEKNTRANYGKIFAMYDDEKTGFLSAKNLRRVAETLGEAITEQEIQELIARADLDQDGLISEEEFYALMTKKI